MEPTLRAEQITSSFKEATPAELDQVIALLQEQIQGEDAIAATYVKEISEATTAGETELKAIEEEYNTLELETKKELESGEQEEARKALA